MINLYLCKLSNVNLENVFQIEKSSNIYYTHLASAMVLKLPYYAISNHIIDDGKKIDENFLSKKNGVLLIRNLPATMASSYYHARFRTNSFHGSPSAFLRSKRFGILKLISFYNFCLGDLTKIFKQTTVISYDNLLKNCEMGFIDVLKTIGIEIHKDLIKEVVEESTIKNMKKLSLSPNYANTPIAPKDLKDSKTAKIRKGGNKTIDIFSAEDLEFIQKVVDVALITEDLALKDLLTMY